MSSLFCGIIHRSFGLVTLTEGLLSLYEAKVSKRCSVFVTFMRSMKMKARPNLENVRELKMILPWNFTASTWLHNEVSYKSHCCCLFTRLSGLFYDFNWLTIHFSQDWSLMERIQPNNNIIIPTAKVHVACNLL